VLTAAAAAPFLRLGRRHQPGARGANVLVIVFPTVAAIGAIAILNLIFIHRFLGSTGQGLIAGTAERFATLPHLFEHPSGWLLIAPVLSAWLVALIVRRPGSILVSTLVFVAILGAFVIGLIPTGSAGNTFILMALMAIALIPTPKEFVTVVMMDIVAVLQIAIAWATAYNRDIVLQWMDTLLHAFNAFGH
jgi:hypothetical protein